MTQTEQSLKDERDRVVARLRELCSNFGDNDWDDDMALDDVVDKHLAKRLYIDYGGE